MKNKLSYLLLLIGITLSFVTNAQDIANKNVVPSSSPSPADADYILFEDQDSEVFFIELQDPYKGFNHVMLKFNKKLDTVIIKPVAKQYSKIVPKYFTKRIFLAFQNLQEPLFFINSTITMKPQKMLNSFWRFFINSTVGILGFYDVASKMGLERDRVSFEAFLEKIGFKPGDYLVLPLIGPSNSRGALAFAVDVALNPITYLLQGGDIYIYRGANMVSTRNEYFTEINDLLYNNDNTYALMKSVYEQKLAGNEYE